MKVGVVSHLYPTPKHPEAGRFISDQLGHLSRLVDVVLYSPLVNRFWFDGGRYDTLPAFPMVRPRHPLLPLRFGNRFNDALMAFFMRQYGTVLDSCDIIHAHLAFPEACAAVRVYGDAKPIVVTAHGSDIHDFANRPKLKARIRESLNRAQAIIAVSGVLKDMLIAQGVTTPIWVIPNGIDTALFTPGAKTEACERLGLDPDRPRILFIGHFVPVKNITQLIRILPMLRETHPYLELVLLGAEPGNAYFRDIQSSIADTGAADMVRIEPLRPHAELPDWYRASDAFVLASRREGFGLVAAEAIACGRPVVTTRSGGPESIVEPGTGILVPHDDDMAFVNAVSDVLDHTGIKPVAEMAESIRRRFSFQSLAQQIVDVYHTVCA